MEQATRIKNPDRVKGGQNSASARWGPRRIVRLDELTPDQRRLVLALIDAVKANTQADR